MTRYFTFDLSETQKKKKQSSSYLFLFIKKKKGKINLFLQASLGENPDVPNYTLNL